MYNTIKKYFALHHNLALPGIGYFSVETIPAHIDYADRCVISSKKNIVFNNDKQPAEKRFYDFLSHELNIDEPQAVQTFTNFTEQLQQQLNNNPVYFKGIGTLTKQTSNVLLFQPEVMPDYFPALSAQRIIRKNATHTVRVGEQEKTSEEMQTALLQPKKIQQERWWIAAIILAVAGISAIVFYYLTH